MNNMYANNDTSGLGDIDALLERAIVSSSTGDGRLSSEELAMVEERLTQGVGSVENGKLLRILALSGDLSYKQTLESFLLGPDPGLAGSALWYLCNYWDLTSEYEGVIHAFLIGVPWDFTGSCQLTAFS